MMLVIARSCAVSSPPPHKHTSPTSSATLFLNAERYPLYAVLPSASRHSGRLSRPRRLLRRRRIFRRALGLQLCRVEHPIPPKRPNRQRLAVVLERVRRRLFAGIGNLQFAVQ